MAINLNPDPSGGHWTSPPLTDRHWYPIYERMVEHDIPAMIHVSTSCNPCFHTTGAHYINADTTAFMQLIQGDLFKDFPTLRFVIPHGGGAAPYHWGRYRGLAQELKKPPLKEHLLNNVFFDTCVYHQPGIDLLTRVVPVENILFASEMIGAVRGVDPETGHNYDDTKRYIEASTQLTPAQKQQIYEGNARRVYPRLDAALEEGKGSDHVRDRSRLSQHPARRRGRRRQAGRVRQRHRPRGDGAGRPDARRSMRPIYAGAQVSGTAVTVLLQPGDNWMLHVAAEQIRPGDVVVAAVTAECTRRLLRRAAGDVVQGARRARAGHRRRLPRRQGADRRWASRSGAARSAPRAPSRRRSARSTSRSSARARSCTRAT